MGDSELLKDILHKDISTVVLDLEEEFQPAEGFDGDQVAYYIKYASNDGLRSGRVLLELFMPDDHMNHPVRQVHRCYNLANVSAAPVRANLTRDCQLRVLSGFLDELAQVDPRVAGYEKKGMVTISELGPGPYDLKLMSAMYTWVQAEQGRIDKRDLIPK